MVVSKHILEIVTPILKSTSSNVKNGLWSLRSILSFILLFYFAPLASKTKSFKLIHQSRVE